MQLHFNQKPSKKGRIHGTKEMMYYTQMDGEIVILRLVFILPNCNEKGK